MEDYVAGGVSGLLNTKKQNSKKKNKEESEVANQLFASDRSREEKALQPLAARLEKLNKLAESILKDGGKKKRKLTDAVYMREASLREADQGKPKKKKKKMKDEDIEEGENQDVKESPPKKTPSKKEVSTSPSKPERASQRQNRKLKKSKLGKESRTVFVGNLPISATKKTLRDLFKEFGKLESIRFRSAAPADLKLPRRATVIKKEFHEKRNNINAYVVFVEKESIPNALSVNGALVDDLHIRVDKVCDGMDSTEQYDLKLSVFVGNLPFDVEEEAVREHFEDCGEVDGVRIIRDRKTGLGKGFGFVLFKDPGAVGLAIQLNEKKFSGRKLRVMKASQSVSNSQGQGKKGKGTMEKSRKSRAGPASKMRMPTNMSSSSFQGLKAKKLTKIKKKLKNKKKMNLKGKTQ